MLQRDLVLYAYNHLDEPVRDFSLDQDIHPLFKVSSFERSGSIVKKAWDKIPLIYGAQTATFWSLGTYLSQALVRR